MAGERDAHTKPLQATKAAVPQGAIETRIDPDRVGVDELPGQRELEPGDQIGDYEVIRLMGSGGMGRVYAARDPRLGRRVAIKLMSDADPEFSARFMLEARATARCHHENIVVIHEVNEAAGYPFMVLEFLEGQTLDQLSRPMAPVRAVEMMVSVVRALEQAHSYGIVHRDLKPENIMVTDSGTVKVLDFGIAKAFAVPDSELSSPRGSSPAIDLALGLTGLGRAIGTPPYMSPEQLRGEEVDGRSDIWAVGILLYELLAGRHPLGRTLKRERLFAIAERTEGGMPPIAEAAPSVPAALAAAVDRCLRYRADERFADAGALLAALESTLPGQGGATLEEGECPYPGLSSFGPEQSDRFFGRDADVRRARTRIREQPLVALMGPSGAGKSSLVRAGLGPSLARSGEPWQIFGLRPGQDPLGRLAALATELEDRESGATPMIDRLRAEPGLLGTLLRRRAAAEGGSVLLCVDQLEELYTLTGAPEDRRTFTACLRATADDPASPARVVVTMRSDFMDRAAEDPAFLDRLARGLVFVAPLDRAGLRDALVRPAALAGYQFDSEELIEEMLDELEAATGALPLLQFAAGKLWDGRDRQARVLTTDSYRAMGGLAGALASHADQVMRELPAEARGDVRAMFQRLVTPERTRAIAQLDELTQSTRDPVRARELVDRLVAARLLVVRSDSEDTTVEIVHESLITRWPTLAHWLAEAEEDHAFLDQLRTTARQWEDRDRPNGLLWRDSALDEARLWHARNPGRELPPRERAYLDAVFELADRARRRRRRGVLAALAVMAMVATAAVIAMLWIRSVEGDARRNAENARDQARRALEAQERAQREGQRAARESERAAAERLQREQAETTARTASARVEETEEDLREVNRQLTKALEEQKRAAALADDAREAAVRERDRARRAEQDLEARRVELERLLREKQQRVEELEKQRRKISTDLK